jgi:hypothetical protein
MPDVRVQRIEPGESHVGAVGGATVPVSFEFSRPADTTAYAVLDSIADKTSAANVLVFPNALRVAGGSGYVTKVQISTDQKANVASYRLWLFSSNPTPVSDNALLGILYLENGIRLGKVDVGPLAAEDATASTCAVGLNTDIRLPVSAGGGQALYGLLETLTVFTPASAQKFWVELTIEQN